MPTGGPATRSAQALAHAQGQADGGQAPAETEQVANNGAARARVSNFGDFCLRDRLARQMGSGSKTKKPNRPPCNAAGARSLNDCCVALQETEYGRSPPGDLVNTHRLFASGSVPLRSSICKAEQPRDLGYMQLAIIEVTNRRTAGSRRNCCSIWPEQSASVHRLRSAKTPSRNTATRFRGGRNRGQREPQTVIIQSNRRLVQKRDLASHAQALLRIGDHSGANPTRRDHGYASALEARDSKAGEAPSRRWN